MVCTNIINHWYGRKIKSQRPQGFAVVNNSTDKGEKEQQSNDFKGNCLLLAQNGSYTFKFLVNMSEKDDSVLSYVVAFKVSNA